MHGEAEKTRGELSKLGVSYLVFFKISGYCARFSAGMGFVVVQILCGETIVKPWFGINIPGMVTLSELYKSFVSGALGDGCTVDLSKYGSLQSAAAGSSRSDSEIKVDLDTTVNDVVANIGCFIGC